MEIEIEIQKTKKKSIEKKILLGIIIRVLIALIVLLFITERASINNLTRIKFEELHNMGRIFATQITDLSKKAKLLAKSVEENNRTLVQIQQLANLGLFSFASHQSSHARIEDADQTYTLQAQLILAQVLEPLKKLNGIDKISLYLVPSFQKNSALQPALTLQLDNDRILISRFKHKGDIKNQTIYSIAYQDFKMPSADFFDISSVYSDSPDKFFEKLHLKVEKSLPEDNLYPISSWVQENNAKSILEEQLKMPVIVTRYTLTGVLRNPETHADEKVPLAIIVLEQNLNQPALSKMSSQLGVPLALSKNGTLVSSSIDSNIKQSKLNEDTTSIDKTKFYVFGEVIQLFEEEKSPYLALALSPSAILNSLTNKVLLGLLWVIPKRANFLYNQIF